MAITDNLISYWKLDEASGQRNDTVGTNHLTDNNTVTQAAGKLGNAAQFTAANTEYLSIADNASLSVGDIDFTLALWVYLDAKTSVRQILTKNQGVLGDYQYAYAITYLSGADRFRFQAGDGTANVGQVNATTLGSPSISTWYYIVAWHDSVANTVNIQVNNGGVDSTAYTFGSFDDTGSLIIGYDLLAVAYALDGRVDSVGFWKRVLTADERTQLYNGGNGLEYPFPVGDGRSTSRGGGGFAQSWRGRGWHRW